jgi:sulfoxide reductase heme-binding subunit YedZ
MTLWYLARASGIVAMLAFTVATAVGALASGRRPLRSAKAVERRVVLQYVHRGAAVTGIALIAVHVTAVVLDSYANVPVTAVVIPMASGYRPLAVTLGALALWAMAAVSLSGMFRRWFARSPRTAALWRGVHLFSYVGWALTLGHALTAGSDTASPAMTGTVVGCVGLVVTGVAIRLRSHAAHSRSSLTIARSQLHAVSVRPKEGAR